MNKATLSVSTTPEEMWKELQEERKLRNKGFDLNNLPQEKKEAINLPLRARILLKLICNSSRTLSVEEQFEALEQPNAKEILKQQALRGDICDDVLVQLFFNYLYWEEVLDIQFFAKPSIELSSKVELSLFRLPNKIAKRVLLKQALTSDYGLCSATELKVFEYSFAKEVLLAEAQKHYLCYEAQMKVFDFSFAKEVLQAHNQNSKYPLCKEAREKAIRLGYIKA